MFCNTLTPVSYTHLDVYKRPLIANGVSLHFADGSLPLVEFSLAVRIHNVAGVLLVLLYSFFVIANAVTGNWWQFVPKPPGILERCWKQTKYYLWGVFKGEHEPYPVTHEENFNAMQALTYWFMIYLVLPTIVAVSYTHLDVYKRQTRPIPMVLVSSANLPESWSLVQI